MIRTKHAVIAVLAGVGVLLFILLVVLAGRFVGAANDTAAAVVLGAPQYPYGVVRERGRVDVDTLRTELLLRLQSATNISHTPLLPTYHEEEVAEAEDAEIEDTPGGISDEKTRLVQVTRADGSVTELTMPLQPTLAPAPQELVSDIVGVGVDGTFMHNTHGDKYDTLAGTVVLVGYALDGFGIYPDSGATDLDICGGRVGPVLWNGAMTEMYHYELSSSSPQILGCFSGKPISATF